MTAPLTVASYNIRKSIGTDRRRRPARVLAVLNEIDADIVALQEVDRRFGERISSISHDEVVDGTDYHPVNFGVRPQSLGWHGNTLFVRKSIGVIRIERLVLPALEPRGAAMADLDIGGVRLRIIGMHLGLVGLWRKRQAQTVLDRLKAVEESLPTVLMGDLNEWNTRTGCLVPFEAEHNVANPGPSYHSSMPMLAYDRIITTRDIGIEAVGVHDSTLARTASDHLPIWARLRLPATEAPASRALPAPAAGER